jgi:hypothetical protein
MRFLKAAHWTPSGFNAHPWCFINALRETPAWPRVFESLRGLSTGAGFYWPLNLFVTISWSHLANA